MEGKIIKIFSNEINEINEKKNAVVFSVFQHSKYMNNYIIFTNENEYDKNKLYYGSVHLKKDSLIVFSVKDNVKKYIEQFLNEFENDNIENFKILNISEVNKLELVSFNEMDYDKLMLLDSKSILRLEKENEELGQSKPVFLYFLLILFIVMGIGLSLLYFFPSLFTVKYKQLRCSNSFYDNDIKMDYIISRDVKFGKNDKVESIDVVRIYTFLDSNEYYEFKNNNQHLDYFYDAGGYKYIDELLQFKIFYQDFSVIDDYDEMYVYLNREGYSCLEKEYEK